MERYLFQVVRESPDVYARAAALTEIGILFRSTHDSEALKVLCEVVADEGTDAELRWLAYILALEIADTPVHQMPTDTPSKGFRVPEDFDQEFVRCCLRTSDLPE